MANTNTVSFSPGAMVPDLQAEQLQLQRRQQLADLLRKQATDPIEQQTVSGRVVPISPWQGVAKMAQALMAGRDQSALDQEQRNLVEKQNKYMGDQATELNYSLTPRPAVPEQNFGPGDARRQLAYLEHTDGPAPDMVRPAEPAYNPGQAEMNAAIVKYLNNTGNSAKSADYVVADAKTRMLANAVRGGPAPSAVAPASTATAPQGALVLGEGKISTAPPTGGNNGSVPGVGPSPGIQPANNQPRGNSAPGGAASPDASGLTPQSAYQLLDAQQRNIVDSYLAAGKADDAIKYMGESLKPHMSTDGKMMVYRGGRAVVVPGSVEAYGQFKKAESAYDAPIALKTESGAEVQLSKPEWADYQKTGKLPLRFLPPGMRDGLQSEADTSGTPGNVNIQTPQGTVGGEITPRLGISQTPQQKAFDDKIGAAGADKIMEGRDTARTLADSIDTIHKSRDLINSGVILGAGADMKTDVSKVLNGMGFNISPDQVANTDFLRSTLGEGLLKNAKKLGVNPTDADARRLESIVGTINKDPKALPMLLDWQEEMARKGISQHNNLASTVKGPFKLSIDLPPAYQVKSAQPAQTTPKPAGAPSAAKRYNPATGRIE